MAIESQTHETIADQPCSASCSVATVDYDRALPLDTLVLPYLPLVRSIASRTRAGLPRHVELDELVSAGMVGLVDAIKRFDPTRERQFVGYARFRIRGAILDFLRSLDGAPRELRKKKRCIDSQVHALTTYLGREPLAEEIAKASDLSLDEYHNVLTRLHHSTTISINLPTSSDGADGDELPIPAPREEDPLYQCIQTQTRLHIAKALDKLAERQRLILTLYYYEDFTTKEISDVLGIAESRVSQLRCAALRELRAQLSSL